ncbi:MAG: HEAT repeat domain-containing protein [Haloferacaceae archaeon]
MSEDADAGEDADAAEETEAGEGADVELGPVERLRDRLDAVEGALEAAETEADLDAVEADLDAVEADLEDADLPEPEEGEDDEADDGPTPGEELESRIGELRDGIEEARGPYGEDVVDAVADARSTVADTRWTDDGIGTVEATVTEFLDVVGDALGASFEVDGEEADDEADRADAFVAALESVEEAVADAGLDADADAETIASLLDASDALSDGLEGAEEWSDLDTREQLAAEGYYDVLGHYKDYPVEWSALKEHEKRGNADMVLLALNSLGSEFMEEHCLEAFERMGRTAATDEAIEEMLARANKRSKPAIRILGKMRAEEAVDTLIEYVDAESDPQLQKVTLKALGEIGSPEAVQPIADQLRAENDEVRSVVARSLGLLGDTRAVAPLSDTLDADENDTVRAAAGWALRQIGTRRALEAAAEYADERSFLVQTEAEKANAALGDEPEQPA